MTTPAQQVLDALQYAWERTYINLNGDYAYKEPFDLEVIMCAIPAAQKLVEMERAEHPVDMSGNPVNYSLSEMPNGEFVGEVYHLTHEVINRLGASVTNKQFIAAETALRDYVWKACQRAASRPKREWGWRPIASAPRDGSEILGVCGLGVAIFWYEPPQQDSSDTMGHDGGWWDSSYGSVPGRSFGNPEHFRTPCQQPTHWMPLPTPPTLEIKE